MLLSSKTFYPLLFALLSTFTLSAQLKLSSPEAVGMSSDRLDYLTDVMQDFVDDGDLPGTVVLVSRRGEVPYFKAFGDSDIEDDVPMKDNTIFRIASQTKAIVSVGIMILQEQGRLLISDPVGDHIPEFKKTTVAVAIDSGGYEVVPADRQITIRDLLTHTAGIGYGGGPAAIEWNKACLLYTSPSPRD